MGLDRLALQANKVDVALLVSQVLLVQLDLRDNREAQDKLVWLEIQALLVARAHLVLVVLLELLVTGALQDHQVCNYH